MSKPGSSLPVFESDPPEVWHSPLWSVSPWNFLREIRASTNFASRPQIYDVTLRDGDQFPGVDLSGPNRIRIAAWLAEAGVKRIEAGRVSENPEDLQSIREIVRLRSGMQIMALAELSVDDVRRAADCGVDGVTLVFPSSARMAEKFHLPIEAIRDLAIGMVQAAKEAGLYALLFPTDATRADPGWYRDLVCGIVKEAPFDALGLVDTAGVISPLGVGPLLSFLRTLTDRPLEVHFHNDFGLATANSLMALAHGAAVVHTTLLGIGERAGNASFEEVVVGAKLLLGVDFGIPPGRLGELPKFMREVSGFARSVNAPIVGESIFDIKLELSQKGCFEGPPEQVATVVYPYHWKLVGRNSPRPTVGRNATMISLGFALEQLGVSLAQQTQEKLLLQARQLSTERRRALTLDEVADLVAEVTV